MTASQNEEIHMFAAFGRWAKYEAGLCFVGTYLSGFLTGVLFCLVFIAYNSLGR
jgi:hypothetical protein